MVVVSKKEGESTESLVRRFTKQVQQSRILIRAKRKRFYEPPKNKREIRESAKRRQQVRERKAYLRRIGKLDEAHERSSGTRRSSRA